MSWQKKQIINLLALILIPILALSLTGCPMTKKESSQPKAPPQNRKAVTEKVNAVASRVEGVDKAYSIVLGNTVLVGARLKDKNVPNTQMKRIESAIGDRVIKEVNVVKTVYATVAPDAVSRIEDISKKINGGQPEGKFAKDIKNIIQDTTRMKRSK